MQLSLKRLQAKLLKLKNTVGDWSYGSVGGSKIESKSQSTEAAPDPDTLQFVGSPPAVSSGTISNWGQAQWFVAEVGGSGYSQSYFKPIVAGENQTADASSFDLVGGSTYDVTVKYEATNALPATSSANRFKTSGAAPGSEGSFSTKTYSGTSIARSIDTGVDNTDKALVWIKSTNHPFNHYLFSPSFGVENMIQSNTISVLTPRVGSVTAFNTDGFDLGTDHATNGSYNFVAWNFAASSKFFDVVKYKGGEGPYHLHDLEVQPGIIMVKRLTGGNEHWEVWSKLLGLSTSLRLNTTDARIDGTDAWNNFNATDTQFAVGGTNDNNGDDYVAYLFADDPDSGIKCGWYEGAGSLEQNIDCGFRPDFLMIKAYTTTGDWMIFDSQRGLAQANDNPINYIYFIRANSSTTDQDNDNKAILTSTPTGFKIASGSNPLVNGNGTRYLYVAIKSTIDTSTYFDENALEAVDGYKIVSKYGVLPDSDAARQLGYRELTEQPNYRVAGYELQADGKYEPIEDFEDKYNAAEELIAQQRRMIIAAACAWTVGKLYEEGEIVIFNGHVFEALTETTATADNDPGDDTGNWKFLGLEEDAAPTAINGYYPLFTTEEVANAAGDGTSHTHVFDGVTYYMPDSGTPIYHGNYTGFPY